MLVINKYAPVSIEDSYFNKPELEKLRKMAEDNAIPHIIFYGPEGCGKRTTVNMFLEMLYGDGIYKLKDTKYEIVGSGNITTEVIIKQSNYHIVIEPNNNNFDRYLIQQVVREYAKRIPLKFFTNNKIFKTVFINNIDNMSYYAQTSLRRTMEKYSHTCRFIILGYSLSKIIGPLKSRCYCFRLKAPTESELLEMIIDVSFYEKFNIGLKECDNIINKSNRNIKTLAWLLDCKKIDESYDTAYDDFIDTVINILYDVDLNDITRIKNLIYNALITNINGKLIMKSLINKLIESNNISENAKIKIIENAAYYEHNFVRKRREMKHIEGFIISIMVVLFNEKHNLNIENEKLEI
jgi:replication factor C subunit 3/5